MSCSVSKSSASDAAQWRSRAARISGSSMANLLLPRRRARAIVSRALVVEVGLTPKDLGDDARQARRHHRSLRPRSCISWAHARGGSTAQTRSPATIPRPTHCLISAFEFDQSDCRGNQNWPTAHRPTNAQRARRSGERKKERRTERRPSETLGPRLCEEKRRRRLRETPSRHRPRRSCIQRNRRGRWCGTICRSPCPGSRASGTAPPCHRRRCE